MDEVAYNQKVKIASIHLDDIAIEWHLGYLKSKAHFTVSSLGGVCWCFRRFGSEYVDPMAELKLVKQVGMVDEYQKEFDTIMTRLLILHVYAISAFITGLKPEIGFTVNNHRPYSLPQAYWLILEAHISLSMLDWLDILCDVSVIEPLLQHWNFFAPLGNFILSNIITLLHRCGFLFIYYVNLKYH